MKRILRNVLLGCGLALCLSLLVYPFLMSNAQNGKIQEENKSQNGQTQEERSSKYETGMQAIKQIAAANNLYNILQENEPGWTLTKASYLPPRSATKVEGYTVLLTLQKSEDMVRISISECRSVEDAKFFLNGPISSAVIKYCKDEECGDEGKKVYRDNGAFAYIGFRKGNFIGSVSCNSEKTAKHFALYVINAISNK